MKLVRTMSLVTLISFAVAAVGLLICKYLLSDSFVELMIEWEIDVDYRDMRYVLGVAQPLLGMLIVLAEFALFTSWLCVEKQQPVMSASLIALMITTGSSLIFRFVAMFPQMFPPTELPTWFWSTYQIAWYVTMLMAVVALVLLGVKMMPRSNFVGVMLCVVAVEVMVELVFSFLGLYSDWSVLANTLYWIVWPLLYLSLMLQYRTQEEMTIAE